MRPRKADETRRPKLIDRIMANSAALIAAMMLGVAGCSPGGALPLQTPPEWTNAHPQVELPRDESAHGLASGEWWYLTGRLVTDDDRTFGVLAVIFRTPLPPFGSYISHYAVFDQQSGQYKFDQTIDPFPATAKSDGTFDVATSAVSLMGADGIIDISAAMSDGRYELDVHLEDVRGPVLHGGDGYVPFGVFGHAYYYSRPRMRATGTLSLDDGPHAVSGTMWFDRQWGVEVVNPLLRWDWFSIRLDDGTDIMLFAFPRGVLSAPEQAPVSLGTYWPVGGEPKTLTADDFRVVPLAWWESERTEVRYDIAWQVEIPRAGLSVSIAAAAQDQEFDSRATLGNSYWEGLCAIEGVHDGRPASGHAFVEVANGGSAATRRFSGGIDE